MMFITFNCYDPSLDKFIVTEMVIEFNMAGYLIPITIKIICFSLDYVKQTDPNAFLVDLLQMFFAMCIASRLIFFKCNRCWSKDKREIEGYSETSSIMVDFLVVASFFAKFFMSQVTNNNDVDGLLNDDQKGRLEEKYVELVNYANLYVEQYQMYTLILIFNVYNLMNALRIFRKVHWIMLIIQKTTQTI